MAYVDLLIPIKAGSEEFQECNSEYGSLYAINAGSPIVAYNQDGYYSYTFHYVKAERGMAFEDYNGAWHTVRFENGLNDLEGKVNYPK